LQARKILEVAIMHTDLALLYPPAQLALATLVVAQDILRDAAVVEENTVTDTANDSRKGNNNASQAVPTLAIDWEAYLRQRFETDPEKATKAWAAVQALRPQLQKGPPPTDWTALKAIHKKLKRVRTWDAKKRKEETTESERPSKRVKSN
jgi:hypothetical protein